MRARKAPLDRALAKVRYDAGCWAFTGALTGGYGVVGAGGKDGRPVYVHRLSYESFVGAIPHKHDIDHLCRNKACCNPLHLEAVPHRENMLRGATWAAENAAKDACPAGHPYNAENTRTVERMRFCRACHRARERARQAIKRAAVAAGSNV